MGGEEGRARGGEVLCWDGVGGRAMGTGGVGAGRGNGRWCEAEQKDGEVEEPQMR